MEVREDRGLADVPGQEEGAPRSPQPGGGGPRVLRHHGQQLLWARPGAGENPTKNKLTQVKCPIVNPFNIRDEEKTTCPPNLSAGCREKKSAKFKTNSVKSLLRRTSTTSNEEKNCIPFFEDFCCRKGN